MKPDTLPPSFRSEGRKLRGPVPPSFEAFYRQQVRYQLGGRIGSIELRQRYIAWAEAAEAPDLGFRPIRRAMENIGHAHRHSNGTYYADAVFAEAVPDQRDNYPGGPILAVDEAASLVRRIDSVAGELGAIRALVARIAGHGSAQHG